MCKLVQRMHDAVTARQKNCNMSMEALHGLVAGSSETAAVGVAEQTMAYRLNEETGIIDYDMLEKTAQLYRPKLLVAGASAYPR